MNDLNINIIFNSNFCQFLIPNSIRGRQQREIHGVTMFTNEHVSKSVDFADSGWLGGVPI
jgi:hypothetical protein